MDFPLKVCGVKFHVCRWGMTMTVPSYHTRGVCLKHSFKSNTWPWCNNPWNLRMLHSIDPQYQMRPLCRKNQVTNGCAEHKANDKNYFKKYCLEKLKHEWICDRCGKKVFYIFFGGKGVWLRCCFHDDLPCLTAGAPSAPHVLRHLQWQPSDWRKAVEGGGGAPKSRISSQSLAFKNPSFNLWDQENKQLAVAHW